MISKGSWGKKKGPDGRDSKYKASSLSVLENKTLNILLLNALLRFTFDHKHSETILQRYAEDRITKEFK